MSLIHKVRVLIGALAHKPFTPRREKADPGQDPSRPQGPAGHHPGSDLEQQQPPVTDTSRVADLMAQQQRREAD